MAFSMKSSIARSSLAARNTPVRSVVRVHSAAPSTANINTTAARPLWYPGNPAPAHLDGTLAGDFGFDPLNLGSDPEILSWMVQAELQHARWAMLGAAGILYTGIAAQAGIDLPQWYDAGEVSLKQTGIPLSSLLAVQFALFHWVETKRYFDWKNPGSQGDGSFFGLTDDLKGKENGYPGGLYFDPFGLARGSAEQYQKYKWAEIRNGRLAMIANLGFWAQHAAIPNRGPIQNLADHLADPTHVTYATNGISVPFL